MLIDLEQACEAICEECLLSPWAPVWWKGHWWHTAEERDGVGIPPLPCKADVLRRLAAKQRLWYWATSEPCSVCAVWIGPHRHLLKRDGTPGSVMERVEPSEDGWRPVVVEARTVGRRLVPGLEAVTWKKEGTQ